MRTISIFIITLLLSFLSGQAQTLKINQCFHDQMNIEVQTEQRLQKKDLNGAICALVKIQLPIAGVKFEGNVIDADFDINEYHVFLSPGTKKLLIKCPNVKPLMLNFSDFPEIGSLNTMSTYVFSLSIETEGPKASHDVLQQEYLALVENANTSYKQKDFKNARVFYNQAIMPKYSKFFEGNSFAWIDECDSILKEQALFRAMTKELAMSIKNISMYDRPQGFSEGVMVVEHQIGLGNLSLITTDGKRTDLSDAFSLFYKLFASGSLPINLNGSNCFIRKDGSISLNYAKSNYNKLFKNDNLNFRPFKNGYSVCETGNGKYGIINKDGQTVLNLTGKYDGIQILDRNIILYDKKHIYKWNIPNHHGPILEKKCIFKYIDYDGMIWDITNDYIIVKTSDSLFTIISFSDNKTYNIYSEWVSAVNSEHILLSRDEGIYLYAIRTGEMKELNASTVSENTIFNGKDCYDLDGNILFSLPEKVDYARAGFTDGYMLVRSHDTYRYIDKTGNTLPGSEFVIMDSRGDESMHDIMLRKPFGDGFGLILRNGEWGLIDRFGTTTFDYQP